MKERALFISLLLLLSKIFIVPAEVKATPQISPVDSLKNILNSSKEDTATVNILNELSSGMLHSDIAASESYAIKAKELSGKLKFKKGIAASLDNLGSTKIIAGNFSEALDYFSKALTINTEINNNNAIASNYNSIGIIYSNQSNYPKALEYYFKALKLEEVLGNKRNVTNCINNIGNIYADQNDFEKALTYYNKALKGHESLNDKKGISAALNNIGGIYIRQEKYPEALQYYLRALKIKEERGNKNDIARVLENIGNVYGSMGEYEKGLEYSFRSLALKEETGDEDGKIYSYNDIGETYADQGKYGLALKYFKKGLLLAENLEILYMVQNLHENLSLAYQKLNQPQNALIHFKAFIAARDTLFNEENTKKLVQSEMNFEFEKKEQAAKLEQDKKELLYKAEVQQQRTQRNAFIAGFALVLALAGVSFRGYRQKQKANKLLGHQKDIIQEKNKDIMDSIHYANRIQTALLKEEEHITDHLPPHFILFKPKDILSGDFYWSLEKQGHLYLAAADCTGHGVPGAMMSMLGIAFLNEITGTEKLQTPAEILDQLRDKIIKDLKSKDGITKDGMDISFVRLNLNTHQMEWSGANNPLWIVKPSGTATEILEIKADKQPIGFYHELKPFTNHEISLSKGDTIYLLTDGYADQFGGEKGKKFKYNKLKELLVNINDNPIQDQKEILNTTFENWKGNLEQVDDVCIIGMRI